VNRRELLNLGINVAASSAAGRFFLRDEPSSPEWIRFSDIVNGSAMRMKLSGADLARV